MSAPEPRHACAHPHAIDWSLAMPVTRAFLPLSSLSELRSNILVLVGLAGSTLTQLSQGVARYHEFFVGRNDIAFDRGVTCGNARRPLGISRRIDFDAQPSKSPQHRFANWRSILPDAGREHDAVKAAHGSRKHPSKETNAVDEILQRQFRTGARACKQVAHIVADARQSF